MANWNRQYRLIAKRSGETGFEIGEPGSDGRAIHINFSIEKKDDSSVSNSATITLWNLSDEQISIIMPKSDESDSGNCSITLSAGYGSTLYTVFCGQVSTATEYLDSADRKIEIKAVDLSPTLKTTIVSLSYSSATKLQTVVNDLVDMLGIPVKYSASATTALNSVKFGNGLSFVGYAQELLDKICSAASSLSWSIANGVLYIRYDSEAISTYVHLLNASTGLIGIPKRNYSTNVTNSSDSDALNVYGYDIDYLMNGSIACGEYIQLESASISGTFLVGTISISGDNVSGDWSCTATVTEASVSNV